MNRLEHSIVPEWPAPPHVRALQTTRIGGTSLPPYNSLNLGNHVGDSPLAVARNRMLLSSVLPSEPVWLEQVHGAAVADADAASCLPQADACIARHHDAVCVVMTADCLPVLLCDNKGTVVGAAHAGWKGMVAGVIEATVDAMNVGPQELLVWLGPAIGRQSFEVGPEVRDQYVENDKRADAAFVPSQDGKWLADLYALATLRLNSLGIDNVYGGGFCTYRDRERFFSYRRDGMTGRMGSFIWLSS
jgi:YfiH family protein